MKILTDISLFSKYVGLRKEAESIETNATVFRTLLEEGEYKERLESLDEDLLFLHAKFLVQVESHKSLFLEHAGPLLNEDKTPNEEFLKLFLVVAQIIGGSIHLCMTYALDLLRVLKPEVEDSVLIEEVTNYTTSLATDGYIKPGPNIFSGEPSEVIMTLSDKSKELVKPELDELRARMFKRTEKPLVLDLASMQPPTQAIN